MRLREIASILSVTERRAYGVVNVAKAGDVLKERDGRRNRYTVQGHLPWPDPIGRTRTVGEVLDLLVGDGTAGPGQGRNTTEQTDGSPARHPRDARFRDANRSQ